MMFFALAVLCRQKAEDVTGRLKRALARRARGTRPATGGIACTCTQRGVTSPCTDTHAHTRTRTHYSFQGKQQQRDKIDEMTSEVVDSNPYSRLMALKRMVRKQNSTVLCISKHPHARTHASARTHTNTHLLIAHSFIHRLCLCFRVSWRTMRRSARCRSSSLVLVGWEALLLRC